MFEVLQSFCTEHALSPFNTAKTSVRSESESILKTKDAKAVATKTYATLSQSFHYADTAVLWHAFPLTYNENEIKKRQEFFTLLQKTQPVRDTSFLKKLVKPRTSWKPPYSVLVVTEDESTFAELQKLSCPVQYLVTEHDVTSLINYDLVQVIDCERFKHALEQLPQAVFINSLDDVYLERYVALLASWESNLTLLASTQTNEVITVLCNELAPLLSLTKKTSHATLSHETLIQTLATINATIAEKMKTLTIAGDALFAMMSSQRFPPEVEQIIRDAIKATGFSLELFTTKLPITLDEEEVKKRIQKQKASEFTDRAQELLAHRKILTALPKKVAHLERELLLFDFTAGIAPYLHTTSGVPRVSEEVTITHAVNLFLDTPQSISFSLSPQHQCSILTGANSGGKTTLLEHAIQLYIVLQLGLPTIGTFVSPLFTDIYYFAKTKGAAHKGAFETLLTQMNEIIPGKKTLILADEIEAVTEPGVAGKMICATADYFIKHGCYLVIATHLGQEIQKALPPKARIDGIEAKGLDENFELLVDHNPVLGRLAHSTPELIIEKMATLHNTPYFTHLHEALKK